MLSKTLRGCVGRRYSDEVDVFPRIGNVQSLSTPRPSDFSAASRQRNMVDLPETGTDRLLLADG